MVECGFVWTDWKRVPSLFSSYFLDFDHDYSEKCKVDDKIRCGDDGGWVRRNKVNQIDWLLKTWKGGEFSMVV